MPVEAADGRSLTPRLHDRRHRPARAAGRWSRSIEGTTPPQWATASVAAREAVSGHRPRVPVGARGDRGARVGRRAVRRGRGLPEHVSIRSDDLGRARGPRAERDGSRRSEHRAHPDRRVTAGRGAQAARADAELPDRRDRADVAQGRVRRRERSRRIHRRRPKALHRGDARHEPHTRVVCGSRSPDPARAPERRPRRARRAYRAGAPALIGRAGSAVPAPARFRPEGGR